MINKPGLEVDLNVSADIARAASAIVARSRGTEDLLDMAAHLCGALSLALFAISKPGHSSDCLAGAVEALKTIMSRVEALDQKTIARDDI